MFMFNIFNSIVSMYLSEKVSLINYSHLYFIFLSNNSFVPITIEYRYDENKIDTLN
jgi:hypothetical protein